MTFGYNANIFRNKAAGNTYSFAENLLAALRRKRPGEAVFHIQIFYIRLYELTGHRNAGHSFSWDTVWEGLS